MMNLIGRKEFSRNFLEKKEKKKTNKTRLVTMITKSGTITDYIYVHQFFWNSPVEFGKLGNFDYFASSAVIYLQDLFICCEIHCIQAKIPKKKQQKEHLFYNLQGKFRPSVAKDACHPILWHLEEGYWQLIAGPDMRKLQFTRRKW